MMSKKQLEEAQQKLKSIQKAVSWQKGELSKIQENIFLLEAVAQRLREMIDHELAKN